MGKRSTSVMTFLFSDVEDSTGLLQRSGPSWPDLLARHRVIMRAAIEAHSGTERGTEGDSFFVTFANPSAAIAAATQAQRELVAEAWPDGLHVRVRMGLHLGEVDDTAEGPIGLAIHHAARIAAAGHGAQIVLSDNVRIAASGLPPDVDVISLGSYRVRDIGTVPIFQLVGPGLPREFPPLRVPPEVPGNLPIELTTFVGRTDEVTALVEEVANRRLITLIGVGGTGKTRLAIETGMAVSAMFPDGCWMVELASVVVPEVIPLAFAEGLGITAPPEGDVIDHIVGRLRDKRLLVIVDNCEHVLAAAAAAAERIVAKCPTVTVLATSREPLMIRGERLIPVAPLSADDAQQLFLTRARDEAPDLQIDEVQRRAIAELCQRLDGLPLALELAASRVRSLSPIELVAGLEERFRLLIGGRRSRMERHQTMRGTLDWSYDLCSSNEQVVFDRLSVFPANFDLAAASAVASVDDVSEPSVADILSQLLDRSLLQRTTAADGTTRYRMLETMRAYGREHLQTHGVSDSIRGRHARRTGHAIWSTQQQTLGPDELIAKARLDEYFEDAIVALDWCVDHHNWEDALRVVWAGRDTLIRETSEMRARLHDAARAADTPAHILDEMLFLDSRLQSADTNELYNETGWAIIRARRSIPSDRFVWSPYADMIVKAEDTEEFVASLEHWRSGPTITRYWAEYWAIRSLAASEDAQASAHVDELLQRFDGFVRGLHSRHATRSLTELNGFIAAYRNDWPHAAKWYRQYVELGQGRVSSWMDLASAWHFLAVRSLDSPPFQPSAAELRDPWKFYRASGFEGLAWHGATSTALGLHRLGNDKLSDRFSRWAYESDTLNAMKLNGFARRLIAAGLPTAQKDHADDHADDINSLVDELFILADELDASAQISSV